MILNEFEAVINLANGPIIFTYYAQRELSRSATQYSYCKVSYPLQPDRKSNLAHLSDFDSLVLGLPKSERSAKKSKMNT